MKKFNFFYSDIGLDNNGNGGPPWNPKFWGFCRVPARHAHDFDAALPHLPAKLRARVQKQLDRHKKDYPDHCQNCGKAWNKCTSHVLHFIADTAGWGNGFTIYAEEDFVQQFAQECELKGD